MCVTKYSPQAFGAKKLGLGGHLDLSHIVKYNGETNPDHWLEDYRLMKRAGRLGNDFMVQYPPMMRTSCHQVHTKRRRTSVGV